MKFKVQLRHFASGNTQVAAIQERIEAKFKFLEKVADENIPVTVKIKQKGKTVNGEWNPRKDAVHMRISFQLNTGKPFMYETSGENFEAALNALKQGTKENAYQQLDKKHTKYQYALKKEKITEDDQVDQEEDQ